MPKYAELSSRLLADAANFFVSLAKQNKPLHDQMLENANVYRQLGQLVASDPGGTLDDVPIASLATKLMRDAATFFETLGDQNEALTDQMTENASVFRQMADLLDSDPLGELGESDAGSDAAADGSNNDSVRSLMDAWNKRQ